MQTPTRVYYDDCYGDDDDDDDYKWKHKTLLFNLHHQKYSIDGVSVHCLYFCSTVDDILVLIIFFSNPYFL